jgi:hypothetical protein
MVIMNRVSKHVPGSGGTHIEQKLVTEIICGRISKYVVQFSVCKSLHANQRCRVNQAKISEPSRISRISEHITRLNLTRDSIRGDDVITFRRSPLDLWLSTSG